MGDFVREFLFGESGIVRDEAGVRSEIVMDLRTEGWIGIPHGGISMGAIVDLFESLHETRRARGLPYPVTMNMRMGGSRLRTGETVHVTVVPEGESAKGIVSVRGSEMPYLEADITKGPGPEASEAPSCLPSSFDRLEGSLSALPFYRNCFVCGIDRRHPGLKRRFQWFDAARRDRVVVSCTGFRRRGQGTVPASERRPGSSRRFDGPGRRDHGVGGLHELCKRRRYRPPERHPARGIGVDEKIVVFGKGERVPGRVPGCYSGPPAASSSWGRAETFETVVTASGQFFGVPALTEQMRTELIPQVLTRQAFEIAESGLP